MKPAGLNTHIWNNNLKSLILLGIYPVLLLGIIWMCAFFIGLFTTHMPAQRENDPMILVSFANRLIYDYFPVILAIIAGWFIFSYFNHTRMIAGMAHAHPVTRQDEPALYNMLENLCIAEGMRMPKFHIIESHALNAFASGINEKTYTVTLTRGLLNRLSQEEVEAVIAHELTHIQNRDVRLLMVTIVFTGMVGLAAQLVWSNLRFNMFFPRGGNGRQRGGAMALMLVLLLILGIGYFATLLMRFALSRQREYMADAGAVRMTKNPEAMMRALMRISGRDHIPEAPADIAFMCIENTKPFMGLFATHPPVDQRLQAISAATRTSIPNALPPVTRRPVSTERKNPWLTRKRGFRNRKNPWH